MFHSFSTQGQFSDRLSRVLAQVATRLATDASPTDQTRRARHQIARCLLLLVMLTPAAFAQTLAQNGDELHAFETLRKAYSSKDAALAASAYSEDAVITYNYVDPSEVYRGRKAIERSFADFFAQMESETLDLQFRRDQRKGLGEEKGEEIEETGIYRLRVGSRGASYGRYRVVLSSSSGSSVFTSDTAKAAVRSGFEALPGPVMLNPEAEDLDPKYYGRLTGRYRLSDDCQLVVTHSFVRLFVRNTCTQTWRGLTRISGTEWTGGETVLSDAATQTYRFHLPEKEDQAATHMTWSSSGTDRRLPRVDLVSRTPFSFEGPQGSTLAGDLYRPTRGSGARATVLVHGSGPQDRNGYASIIAVMAEQLAASGQTVLTFDKRGVRESSGDWGSASFADLAADAGSALRAVESLEWTDPKQLGLAGSSQAGWVVAKALEQGADVAHVVLLGAAGAALTVREQNLYNTEVRMRCAGISESDIDIALSQQAAFFDFVADPKTAANLDRVTAQGRKRAAIVDWLFPSSQETDLDAGNWFTTLEIDFDPLPVWQRYRGTVDFLFSEHDDSTPTETARARLLPLAKQHSERVRIHLLSGAQHIGLDAQDICADGIAKSSRFVPQLIEVLSRTPGAQD